MRPVPEDMAVKLEAAANSLGASFDDVRIDEIAELSGIPRATLYYYFRGKDEILAFLLRSALADLVAAAAHAVGGPGDAAERLSDLIAAQLDHLGSRPGTSQLLIANLGKAGRLPEIAAQLDAGFHGPVRKLLREGVDDGSLRDVGDPEVAASAFFGAVTAVGLRSIVVRGAVPVEHIADSLTSLFFDGVAQQRGPNSH
jgi:AcrR family transcriptional regulator